MTRRDIAMVRRAIRENWAAAPAVRAAAIDDLADAMLTADGIGRLQIAAVSAIVDAEAVNPRIDHAEQAAIGLRRPGAPADHLCRWEYR